MRCRCRINMAPCLLTWLQATFNNYDGELFAFPCSKVTCFVHTALCIITVRDFYCDENNSLTLSWHLLEKWLQCVISMRTFCPLWCEVNCVCNTSCAFCWENLQRICSDQKVTSVTEFSALCVLLFFCDGITCQTGRTFQFDFTVSNLAQLLLRMFKNFDKRPSQLPRVSIQRCESHEP